MSGVYRAIRNRTLGYLRRIKARFIDDPAFTRVLSKADPQQVIIIFSTVDWNFPYRQRPQHFARAFSRNGYTVFYGSPFSAYDDFSPCHKIEERLYAVRDPKDIMHRLPKSTVMLLSTDNTIDDALIDEISRLGCRIIYDYIDELSAAISRSDIPENKWRSHHRLLKDPNVICICAASALFQEARSCRNDGVRLVTNGVWVEDFDTSKAGHGTETMRRDFKSILDSGKPIAGYYGALAEWLDLELLKEVAAELDEVQFVLIGPDYDGSIDSTGRFPRNVHILPPMDYAHLAIHARHFSVCMIPFKVNSITEATSPLKLFEYMAMGKPVVSTRIREAGKYQSVLIGDDAPTFASQIERALQFDIDGGFALRAQNEARQNSWIAKAEDIVQALG